MRVISKLILFIIISLVFVSQSLAATFRSGDNVFITNNPLLDNAYLAGDRVELSSPAEKDVLSAGGTLLFESSIERSLMAAGGTVSVKGPITQSARIVGGSITIDTSIGEDLIVAGGEIHITKNASISGDVVMIGGTLEVDGNINGNVQAHGGTIIINSKINGDVSGEMGQLTLGPEASIAGNLTYTSNKNLIAEQGSIVQGKTTFTQNKNDNDNALRSIFAAGTIYKLIVDILFSLLFVLVLGFLTREVIERIEESITKSFGFGLSAIVLMPLIGLFLLLIFWLGITWFVFYLLLLLLTLGIMKIYIGTKILSWWENRKNKEYILDWKAAIVGPIIVILLSFIPVIGWIILILLYILSFGGLIKTVISILSNHTSTTHNGK